MKPNLATIRAIAALLIIVFTTTVANATNYFSRASGNWTTNTTWSLSSGGGAVGAGVYPVAGDNITIEGGFNVTLTADAACTSITFTTATATSLTLGAFRLDVSGAITIPRSGSGFNQIIVGSGTLNGGSVAFTSGGGTNRHQITISTGTVTISGNVTQSGSTGSATIAFSGAGLLKLGGTFLTDATGALTLATGCTVEYYAAGAQTIGDFTYNNLTLSGSGAKTVASTLTVTVNAVLSMEGTATITTTGTLTYGSAATLQYNTATARTASSNEWKSPFTATGGVIIDNTGAITLNAAKQFGNNTNVPLNIKSGATLTPGSNLITLHGNFINDGVLTSGSGGFTIAGTVSVQSIGGFTTTGAVSMTKTGGTATLQGDVNGAGLTINGTGGTLNLGASLTHTFTGTWTRTNGTLNGGSSTINFSLVNIMFSGTGGTFTAGTGTVALTNAAAQTFPALTYNNLTLSGGGTKTVATTPTVNGILSMEGTAAITVTTGVVTYGSSATLQYNKGASYTATTEEWISPFAGTGGIIIKNTGAITTPGAVQIGNNNNAPLNINSGATLTPGSNLITLHGDFINGGTLTSGSGGVTIAGTVSAQAIDGFTTTGTVSMTKTSGTATLQGDVNGAGLTINGSGGTLNLGASLTHTFTGTWTRTNGTLNGGSSTLNFSLANTMFSGTGGTFTAATGTVALTNAAAQTFPALTYNNLTLSGGGTKTVATTPTVNGILSMEGTAAITVTGAGVVTYGSSATLQYNKGASYTATSEEWITPFAATGGVIIANTGAISLDAAKVFNASVPLTINSGATLNTTASNFQLTFGGNFINNGTLTANASPIVITNTMVTQSIDGFTTTGLVSMTKASGTATFQGNVNGNGLTINGASGTLDLGTGLTHIFTGAWTKTAGTLNGSSSTLKIGGSVSGSGGGYVPGTSTVEWYAAGPQTIAPVSYHILIVSGSGAKTVTGSTINGTLSIQGTATTLGSTPVYGGSAVLEYKGSSAQTTSNVEFGGTGADPANVTIDNAGGVILNAAKTIDGALTLTSGYLTTTAANLLTINTAGSASNSGGAFVNGPLAKTGSTAFTFLVGVSGTGIRTIAITAPSVSSTFTAEFKRNNANMVGTALGAGIYGISGCEYWTLDRSGTGNASVTLSWESGSSCNSNAYVTDLSTLRVAHWDGSSWINEGNSSTTGNVTAGTITTGAALTSFSPFSLGAGSTSNNPLPVTFADVKAYEKNSGVQVEWSNMTERDLVNYSVERSANGADFTVINQQLPRSNQNNKESYSAFDASPFSGANFYRIRILETSGKVVYSKVLKVDIGGRQQGFTLYPNPVAGGQVSLSLNAKQGQYSLKVLNASGQEVYSQKLDHRGGSMTQTIELPSTIKPGVYNMVIGGDNYRESKTFVVK